MALKVLLMRSKLDAKKKQLEDLRAKDEAFQTREAEFESAISEMTEETTEEDRAEVERQADEFSAERSEHESKKSALESEIEEIERSITEEEKKAAPAPAAPAAEKEERGMKRMETREFFGMNMQERDAFFTDENVKGFLGTVRSAIKEKRAISNTGLLIPQVMIPMLRQVVAENSKLVKYVNLKAVNGTSRQNIMGTIPEGVWTEMTGILNELSLTFNDVEVDGYKVGGFIAVANSIVEDADIDLASELLSVIGKAIAKALDKAIVYGTGTKMPLGFITRLAQTAQPSGYSATARTWEDLSSSNVLALTAATGKTLFQTIITNSAVADAKDYSTANMTWLMNHKTHVKLLAESIGANMNAALVAGMNNQMPILGGDIVELDFMADNDIAFGYLDLYTLAERAGTKLASSEEAKFIEDQTVFKGTARYDGCPAIAEAFGIINIANTAPTTSVTFPTDSAN